MPQVGSEFQIAILDCSSGNQRLMGLRFDKHELIEFDGELVPTVFIPLEEAVEFGLSVIQSATLMQAEEDTTEGAADKESADGESADGESDSTE